MSITIRHIFLTLGGAAGVRAAEFKHDLYFCVNLGGQAPVMGRGAVVLSGIYRSTDRVTIEHVGPAHIRMFKVIADLRDPNALFVSALDGVMRTPDLGKTWRILASLSYTQPHPAFEAEVVDIDDGRLNQKCSALAISCDPSGEEILVPVSVFQNWESIRDKLPAPVCCPPRWCR